MTKHRQFCTSSSHTLAGCKSKQVRNKGSDDKQAIIATFTFTHDGQLLGMQLIGRGKTKQSLPRQQSPAEFSLNVNHNHYSNQKESIKFIEEILVPIRIAKPRSSGNFKSFQRSSNWASLRIISLLFLQTRLWR